MSARRVLDAPQWLERAPKARRSSASSPSGPHADAPLDQALAFPRELHDDEGQLELLIDEVREARERLADLIASIKSERAGWNEREQRWERWRSQLQNPPRKALRRDVH